MLILRYTEYPPLTHQRILSAFLDSGVLPHHVHQLGIMLGLAGDVVETIKKKSEAAGPAMFATNTVYAWLERHPEDDIRETYSELEKKLRQVHLNCVVGRLKRKEIKGDSFFTHNRLTNTVHATYNF